MNLRSVLPWVVGIAVVVLSWLVGRRLARLSALEGEWIGADALAVRWVHAGPVYCDGRADYHVIGVDDASRAEAYLRAIGHSHHEPHTARTDLW